MKCVCDVAAKHGIPFDGLKIKIARNRTGYRGSTGPTGLITLTRRAFDNEEQLARTLAHERFHVDQLRSGMTYPTAGQAANVFEKAAYNFEDWWWATTMVDDPEAVYESWLDCYEIAYQDPAGIRDLACPNCGQRMLALRFDVKVMEADLGIAKFWCDSCLMGLMPNTATVPVGGARALWDTPGVPNYLVVAPAH